MANSDCEDVSMADSIDLTADPDQGCQVWPFLEAKSDKFGLFSWPKMTNLAFYFGKSLGLEVFENLLNKFIN